MEERQKDLDDINTKYQKLKVLLEQKGCARTRRQNISTSYEMIKKHELFYNLSMAGNMGHYMVHGTTLLLILQLK